MLWEGLLINLLCNDWSRCDICSSDVCPWSSERHGGRSNFYNKICMWESHIWPPLPIFCCLWADSDDTKSSCSSYDHHEEIQSNVIWEFDTQNLIPGFREAVVHGETGFNPPHTVLQPEMALRNPLCSNEKRSQSPIYQLQLHRLLIQMRVTWKGEREFLPSDCA